MSDFSVQLSSNLISLYITPLVTHCPDLSGNPDFENSEIRKIRIFEILSEENNSTLVDMFKCS